MSTLNSIEVKVLNEIQRVADSYGEEGGFILDEVNLTAAGITFNQLKGYVGELSKKDILAMYTEGGCYFDGVIIGWIPGKTWN